MSDLRVALVAEGPTDAIVIEAALKGLLPRPFVLTQLQPEPTRPKLGTGWGGVLRWCLEFAMRGHARVEDDPTLPGFDLFVIHVDADVAEDTYADVSDELVEVAKQRGWPVLPRSVPCPPPREVSMRCAPACSRGRDSRRWDRKPCSDRSEACFVGYSRMLRCATSVAPYEVTVRPSGHAAPRSTARFPPAATAGETAQSSASATEPVTPSNSSE